MAVKTPHERYQETTSLFAAQKLYRRLGDQLASAKVRGGQVLSRPLRQEARDVRRLLEQEYGAAVRTASAAGVTGPGQGRFEKVVDPATKRRHFTINKPRVIDPRAPILHVVIDPSTGEPTGGAHRHYVDALLKSWEMADSYRSRKREKGRGLLSKAAWNHKRLEERIGHLQETLKALSGLTAWLAKEGKRLQTILKALEDERRRG